MLRLWPEPENILWFNMWCSIIQSTRSFPLQYKPSNSTVLFVKNPRFDRKVINICVCCTRAWQSTARSKIGKPRVNTTGVQIQQLILSTYLAHTPMKSIEKASITVWPTAWNCLYYALGGHPSARPRLFPKMWKSCLVAKWKVYAAPTSVCFAPTNLSMQIQSPSASAGTNACAHIYTCTNSHISMQTSTHILTYILHTCKYWSNHR